MKNKKSPVGQYILEGVGDTDNAHEYVEELLPLIGKVVLFFNALESDIDELICADISDRSDHKGLLVLHNMTYATKVKLYERFKSEELRICGWELPSFNELISKLSECGTLRNKVIHASWENTNNGGYTHVRFKMGKDGLEHEYLQFSADSLKGVIEKIIEAREKIDQFEEQLAEKHDEFQQKKCRGR